MGADLPAIGIVLPLGAQCELSLAAPAALFLVRWRWTARSVTRGDKDKDHVTSEARLPNQDSPLTTRWTASPHTPLVRPTVKNESQWACGHGRRAGVRST